MVITKIRSAMAKTITPHIKVEIAMIMAKEALLFNGSLVGVRENWHQMWASRRDRTFLMRKKWE